MRTIFRSSLAIILSGALAGIPALAAPAKPAAVPLGVILQADRATVGTDLISGGATVYEGETLETDGNGTMRVRLGGSQMFLRSATSSEVHGLPNGFSASLKRGTIVASSVAGETFQVLANGAVIRPAAAVPTVAQVTMVTPKQLLLTPSKGAIEVSMGDEVRTLEAGNSYRLEVAPEEAAAPAPQQRGPYHTARNRFIIITIAAVSAVTAYGVWRALESPDKP